MAEVKNAFIKSKMNKDLDSRLVPQGEYRDAVNIQVSKSEGDDVGALENVLGNVSVADFEPSIPNLSCIGYFVNEFNNTVFLFFTDYTDLYNTPNQTYNPAANNFIYSCSVSSMGNPPSATITKLVEGAFLNFSKNRPIIGVNVLEDFLFWTDNRNQPRKINWNLASSQGIGYYTNEDQISVAKYYPYQSIELIEDTITGTGVVTVATSSSLTAVLSSVSGNILAGAVVGGNGITAGTTVVSFVQSTGDITFNQANTIPQNTDLTFTLSALQTTMQDVSSEFLPDGTTLNPYYNPDFPGDPQFLEDKFVRFSYRFKFKDNEYSLIAPFTQPCFIPKQDGYFIEGDETQTLLSTVVNFMENKVTQIDLQIPLPFAANQLETNLHVSEIDIIYKESDGLALQVVDTIPINEVSTSAGSNTVFEYVYNSTKPYKTLPEKEITRVYDKVPVKALGQEIISNRIVYSNFQDKHTPPAFVKYQVGANDKYPATNPVSSKSIVEYPNHSLKQNRNYQVGIVLADRYGRQSTVILSNDQNSSQPGGFGADTVYLPYRTLNDSISFAGDSLKISVNEVIQSQYNETNLTPGLYNDNAASSGYLPLGWYSYKIVVKQLEQEYYNVYLPSAMKGEPYWYNGNPPLPTPTLPRDQNASYVILLNDNINKVPRDLNEVGPQDKQFRSSVRLFGRVENTTGPFSNIGNAQFFPGKKDFTVNQIEDLFDAFDTAGFIGENSTSGDVIPITSSFNPYYAFLRSESNPFMAEFVTSQLPSDQFGVINEGWNQQNPPTTIYEVFNNLVILETAPTVSRLDLFYETSTSGIISVLNTAISENTGGALAVANFTYSHFENYNIGTSVATGFYFTDFGGNKLALATAVLTSVFDNSGSGTNRANEFTLVSLGGGDFELRTNAYFYYGSNAGTLESYTFTFTVTDTAVTNVTATGFLQNTDPTIDNDNSQTIIKTVGEYSILTNLTGVNGTADPTKNTIGLTFTIASSTGSGTYQVINNNQVVNTDTSAAGSGTFTLQLTDAGNPIQGVTTKIFNVQFDQPNTNIPDTSSPSQGSLDGDGLAYWITNDYDKLTDDLASSLGNSTAFINGLTAVTLVDNPISTGICSGADPYFYNKKISNALTTGTFYVYLNVFNSKAVTGSDVSQIHRRYSISYRPDSNSTWGTAVDINDNTALTAATWTYNSSKEGWDSNQNEYILGNAIDPSITVSKQENNITPRYGGLVYAFNQPGEYRIICGNLSSAISSGGSYSTPFGIFYNSVNCNRQISADLESSVFTGDFYYPIDIEIGQNDGVFRYQIAGSNACNTTFTPGTNYYAREPLAKYVTQLYTDQALTTKASLTAGLKRFRKMENLNPAITTVSNPEYTREGAYTAEFNNTGLRTTVPSPCLY